MNNDNSFTHMPNYSLLTHQMISKDQRPLNKKFFPSTYTEAMSRLIYNERWRAVDEKEREDVFKDYIDLIYKKEEEEWKKERETKKKLLKSNKKIEKSLISE